MKRIWLLLPLLLLLNVAHAENEEEVKSKIKKVTVFLKGAQVTRTGYVSIASGATELIFDNVSPYVIEKSIQVRGKGDFVILDVRHENLNTGQLVIEAPKLPAKIQRGIRLLNDSILEMDYKIREVEGQREALSTEKSILLNNPAVKGQGKAADSIPLLRDAMFFFREKVTDINAQLLLLDRKEADLNLKRNGMQERLQKLHAYHVETKGKNTGSRIVVSVSAKAGLSGNITLSYMVNHAGWAPSYDLRASNTSTPIDLTFKANVYQSTGTDWDNVRLKLSTYDPFKSNAKPALRPVYLGQNASTLERQNQDRVENLAYQELSGGNYTVTATDISCNGTADGTASVTANGGLCAAPYTYMWAPTPPTPPTPPREAQTSAAFTKKIDGMVSAEFDIELPYTIKSNNQSHNVAVAEHKIAAKYYHYVVPKLDQEAFLMASLSDWEELNLLPANASLYFDDSYIGQTTIDPTIAADTLLLSLGRDRDVVVTRRKLESDLKDKGGDDTEQSTTYEIMVRNTKSRSVHLIIEDQIPVSNDDEVKVKLAQSSKAAHDEQTGFITWDFRLKGRDTKKLKFTYTVTYDKTKPLVGESKR